MKSCITQHQTMKHCDTGITKDERIQDLTNMVVNNGFRVVSEDGQVRFNKMNIIKGIVRDGDGDNEVLLRVLLALDHKSYAEAGAYLTDMITDVVKDKIIDYVNDYEGDKF